MFKSIAKKSATVSVAALMLGMAPSAWAGDPVQDTMEPEAETIQTLDEAQRKADLKALLVVGTQVFDAEGASLGWISSVIEDEEGKITAVTLPDTDGSIAVDSLDVADGKLIAVIEKAEEPDGEGDDPYNLKNPESELGEIN